jgi:hypothetical protein
MTEEFVNKFEDHFLHGSSRSALRRETAESFAPPVHHI